MRAAKNPSSSSRFIAPSLAALEEVAEAVELRVGQRVVLGEHLHGEPSIGKEQIDRCPHTLALFFVPATRATVMPVTACAH